MESTGLTKNRLRIVTRIPWRGNLVNVNYNRPPHDTRQLRGFLLWNNARDCFMRGEGGWYRLGKDGSINFVCRTLYLLSLKEWLEIALNDKFIANNK